MTGYQSKKTAALDEDGMYLVHQTAQQDATMQSLKDLKRSMCDEVGKAAFAQPAQEPVADALIRQYITALVANKPDEAANATKAMVDYVYTTPPAAAQRTWVGLTNEEIAEFDTWHDNREEEVGWCNPSEIVAYIEAKLKEKNA
jgi:hypothetical protein